MKKTCLGLIATIVIIYPVSCFAQDHTPSASIDTSSAQGDPSYYSPLSIHSFSFKDYSSEHPTPSTYEISPAKHVDMVGLTRSKKP